MSSSSAQGGNGRGINDSTMTSIPVNQQAYEIIQKKANDIKPATTNVDEMNFDEEDTSKFQQHDSSQRPIHNPNYFMEALPADNANNAIVDNLDIDPDYYPNANFGEMNGDDDNLGLGNIGQPRRGAGPASVDSKNNEGEDSDEDADVFK